MRLSLVVGFLVSLTLLLSCLPSLYAHEKVENRYFSLKVPHTWRFDEHSNTQMASLIGIGPANQIILVPSEFDKVLLDRNEGGTTIYEDIQDGGAFSQFTQDTDNYVKDTTLPTYIGYFSSKYPYLSITSMNDSIVGKEKAIKIEGSDNSSNIRLVIYLMVHDKNAYNLDYVANVNNFGRYLPDFEGMIKSFKFND